MKNLKRIFAVVLTVAMMLTLVSVSVSVAADETLEMSYKIKKAADGTDFITETKAGKTVYVDCYISDATYVMLTVEWAPVVGTFSADNVTFNVPGNTGTGFNAVGNVYLNYFAGATISGNPVITVAVTLPDDADATDALKLIEGKTFSYTTTSMGNGTLADANIKVLESFVATSAEATVETTYPIGAEVATVLAEKAAVTVKGADDKAESGYKATFAAPAEFNNTVPGTYEFTGTVITPANPDDVAASWEGDLTFKLNVTLTALTTGEVTASMDAATIKAEKEARDVTDDELKALFADATFEVAANGIEDTMTVASWAVDKTTLNITEVGTTAKVTATLNTKSAAEKFEFAEAPTVDFTVTVVAAEIADAKIEVKNKNLYSIPSITITVPAEEIVADTITEVPVYDETKPVYKVDGEGNKIQAKDENDQPIFEEDGTTPVYEVETNEDGSTKYEQMVDEEGNPVVEEVVTGNNVVVATINGDEASTEAILAEDAFQIVEVKETVITEVQKTDEEGNPVWEKDADGNDTDVPVMEEVETEVVKEYAVATIEFDKKLSAYGFENGDELAFGASLNGAPLVIGNDENGEPVKEVISEAKKPVGGGGSTIKPSTSTNKGDDTTDNKDEENKQPVVDVPDSNVPVTEGPFADVAADHWAAASIAQLKEAGVVNGSGDGNYTPEADITRAEFTKMVVGVMGLEAAAAEVAFEDCTAGDWFTPYVAAAVEAGLVNGVSETEFAPNATITREQAFAIIGRAIDAEATTAVAFTDAADIDEYAAPYVALLVELGIVNGYEDNTIRPDANITRAEAAKILAGFMDKLKADAEVLPKTEEVVEEATEEVVEEATEEVVDEK